MATFERSIKIDAPMEKVWSMLTNAQTWESWFPDVERITNLSGVSEGATFDWQEGAKSGRGTITQVDTNRGLIKVVLSDGNRDVSHTFDLDQAGGFFGIGGDDTSVKYRREYDAAGGFLGEFVAGGNPADSLDVKRTLDKIKQLAGR